MNASPSPLRLHGSIQPYAWGGTTFIPQLLGQPNDAGAPYAELWLGAHDRSPALVELDSTQTPIPLDALIARAPAHYLGTAAAEKFQQKLPFLFKILDVAKMLSIQAHPSKAEAEAGFAAENAAGIPLSAPHRNFKDDNHKPEMMVALTDFYLLHGFLPLEQIAQRFHNTPELAPLWSAAGNPTALPPFFAHLMELPQEQVNHYLEPLAFRLLPALAAGGLDKASPDYWAARALRDFRTATGGLDRGVFSIYCLNVVFLQPGEGIFQDAGLLHAYLEGVNVELMANSDNVFRGGLTDKHIDVPLLLQHLDFAPTFPNILRGEPVDAALEHYPTPATDFALYQLKLDGGERYAPAAKAVPAILLLLNGEGQLNGAPVKPGQSFFIPAGSTWTIESTHGCAGFLATLPL